MLSIEKYYFVFKDKNKITPKSPTKISHRYVTSFISICLNVECLTQFNGLADLVMGSNCLY